LFELQHYQLSNAKCCLVLGQQGHQNVTVVYFLPNKINIVRVYFERQTAIASICVEARSVRINGKKVMAFIPQAMCSSTGVPSNQQCFSL